VIRERQDEEILEWICPGSFITHKRREEVFDTHQLFFKSEEYLNWVGEGPSALICTGQRTFLCLKSL